MRKLGADSVIDYTTEDTVPKGAVEIVMMYYAIYDFITSGKIDRLRKKRFDKLPDLHSDAVKNGLFESSNIFTTEFLNHASQI